MTGPVDLRPLVVQNGATQTGALVIPVPEYYTATELADKLSERLTKEELSLVVNPLAITPQMEAWAHQLTANATNDEKKARLLFDKLAWRKQNSKDLENPMRGTVRTAREVFGEWDNLNVSFTCKDNALLYESLARAVGIEAFDVYVQETFNGDTQPHDCALVVIDHRGIFVDPSYFYYGAPHRRFIVLNDLQMIALYMSGLNGLKYSAIAAKLAPELPLVQQNYFEKLLERGRVTEAREMLPLITRSDTNFATAAYAEGSVALFEGRTASGVDLLRKAIAQDPNVGVYHYRLASAFAQEGDFGNAHQSLEAALKCPLMADEARWMENLVESASDLAAWGYAMHGSAMIVQSNLYAAIVSFQKAVEAKPDFVDGYEMIGCLDYDRHQFKEALINFHKAIQMAPSEAYAHFRVWLIRSKMGEKVAATDQLRLYLQGRQAQSPSDWPQTLGDFLVGQMSDEELFKEAEEFDTAMDGGTRCEAFFYAGLKHLLSNDKSVAENYFRKCVATGASNHTEFASAVSELHDLGEE